MEEQKKKRVITACLIIGAIISIIITRPLSSPESHKKAIESLSKKQDNVMVLTGVAASTSFAVSAIPGDAGTPLAEKLADLTDIFGTALIAVLLEKYMLTVGAYVGFGYLIPIGLLLIIFAVYNISEGIGRLGTKLICLGIMLTVLAPISVHISNLIDRTYSISYEATVTKAEQIVDDIADATESTDASTEINTEAETEKNKNILSGITDTFNGAANGISNIAGEVADGVTGAVEEFTGNVSEILDNATKTFNDLLEAAAAMIVTSCVLPFLVFAFLLWAMNMILGANIKMPHLASSIHRRKAGSIEKKYKEI